MAVAPPPLNISQTDLGIGDILCSLYALEGLSIANGRPPMVLHMADHRDWLQAVAIPNLDVVPLRPENAGLIDIHLGDSEAQYRQKLRENHDPKCWYGLKLGGVEPQRPAINPALATAAIPFRKPFVVLAPFATRTNRTWEIHNWRLLADQLKAAGYQVIALDAPNQPGRCAGPGCDYWFGQRPLWTMQVCQQAALVISNDSALSHLGGLLGVKTLVLLSQQNPERYFSLTDNAFIRPQHACVGCRFQPELGYEPRCDFGCWALQSISPRTVAETALQLLENARQPAATRFQRSPAAPINLT